MANSNLKSIAMVYAEALFELAAERGQIASVHDELRFIAQALHLSRELNTFLATPAIRGDRKLLSLSRIFTDKLSNLVMNCLKVLASRDRLGLLAEIQVCFTHLADQQAGRVEGTLVTAIELDKKEQVSISEKISRLLRKTVSLQAKVDKSILGGMILTVDDTVMDGSIKRLLQRFARRQKQQTARQLPDAADLITE